jgi:hypothetical protein
MAFRISPKITSPFEEVPAKHKEDLKRIYLKNSSGPSLSKRGEKAVRW